MDFAAEDRGPVPQREMPRYKCHKEVWALKIARIEQAPADQERVHAGGDWMLIPEDAEYGPVCVGHEEYILKHKPQAGGYYVVYDDGYKSYSPAAPFEAGYTPIPAILPHQLRVVAEKAELDDRLNKLLVFTTTRTYAGLSQDERNRLSEQANYMQAYSNVLGERIAAFQLAG